MKIVKRCFGTFLSLLSLCSCVENEQVMMEMPAEDELVEVMFVTNGASGATRSSISSEDDGINDFKICSYRDGELDRTVFVNGGLSAAKLKMIKGERYNVYAIANAGDVPFPMSEAELEDWRYGIDSVEDMGKGFPMSWKSDNLMFNTSASVNVSFERLVSRLSFSIDPGLLLGLEVTSVKLCNCASSVTPFSSESKAESADSVMDGDYASSSDLEQINKGGSIVMYALENCQGTLLPDNTDPMNKIPENLLHPELCTYLEVECQFNEEAPIEGYVLYRIFPGNDSTTNFDLRRNVDYSLQLCLTSEGLDEVSWRVEVNAGYKPSLGSWKIVEGMHDADNLYIGEVSLVEVNLDPSLVNYLDGRLNDCKVVYGNGVVALPSLTFEPKDIDGNRILCEMTCNGAANSSTSGLYLYGGNGKMITDLVNRSTDRIVVKKPILKRMSDKKISPKINGSAETLEVFLEDESGHNLNSSEMYGFSLEPFKDLSLDIISSPAYAYTNSSIASQMRQSHVVGVEMGAAKDNGPLAKYSVKLVNDGTSSQLNREWSALYGADWSNSVPLWNYRISSENASSLNVPASFEIIPIKAYFYGAETSVDELYVPYIPQSNDSYLAVDNSSNIAFTGQVFLMGTHVMGFSKVPGPKKVRIMNKEGAAQLDVIAADATFLEDAAITDKYYESTIDHRPVRCYPLVKNSGKTYLSVMQLSERVKASNGTMWDACQMDIIFKTLEGRDIEVELDNLYFGRKFSGVISWTGSGNMASSTVMNSFLRSQYNSATLERIFGDETMSFDLKLNPLGDVVLDVDGNMLQREYYVEYQSIYTTECSWHYLQKDNYSTSTYKEFYTMTTRVPSHDSQVILLKSNEVVDKFSYMNHNYWHENSNNLINVAGNRHAVFSMPKTLEVIATIKSTDPDWVPVTLKFTGGTDQYLAQKAAFYTRTANGTYPDNKGQTNPDGSSRGADKSASNVAGYSDYTHATYASYELKGSCDLSNSFSLYRF